MIAAAFGLAGLMGATLLVGTVMRGAYEAERDVSLIGAEATAAAPSAAPTFDRQEPDAG